MRCLKFEGLSNELQAGVNILAKVINFKID